MSHKPQFEEYLLLYFYDELEPSEKVLFEKHLEGCPHCQKRLVSLQEMEKTLQSVPDPTPSAVLIERANQRVMQAIARQGQFPLRERIRNWIDELGDAMAQFFAQPRYQLVTAGVVFVLGILVGKMWLSSGLMHDPQMLANFVNRGALMTSAEREDFQKAFANYMLSSGDIEISDLAQQDARPNENGLIQVNVKIEKDMALSGGLDDPTIQNMLRYSALNDADPEKRQRAIRLLSKAERNPLTEETLVAIVLQEKVAGIRLQSLQALAEYPDNEQIVESLKSVALNDSAQELRMVAMERLFDYGQKDVIPIFALLASQEQHPGISDRARDYLDQLVAKNTQEGE